MEEEIGRGRIGREGELPVRQQIVRWGQKALSDFGITEGDVSIPVRVSIDDGGRGVRAKSEAKPKRSDAGWCTEIDGALCGGELRKGIGPFSFHKFSRKVPGLLGGLFEFSNRMGDGVQCAFRRTPVS